MKDQPLSLAAHLAQFEQALGDTPLSPDHWESRWEFIRSTDQLILPEDILFDFFIPNVDSLSLQAQKRMIAAFGKKSVELARLSDWYASDVHLLQEFRGVMYPQHPQVHMVSLALLKLTYAVWHGTLHPDVIKKYQDLWFELADLCGCWRLRYVMEDEIFAVQQPREYKLVLSVIKKYDKAYLHILNEMIAIVRHYFAMKGIKNFEIYARRKNIYGIYQKIRSDNKTLGQVRDVFGIRIITGSVSDCYKALHAICALWPQYQEYFKDFIKLPKPNGYQSLHATVCGLMKQDVEFQIRTRKMHEVAQFGLANHAHYKAAARSTKRTRA